MNAPGTEGRNAPVPQGPPDTLPAQERLWATVGKASAPLFIWLLQFFASYALVAVGCTAGWSPLASRLVLIAFTMAAIAAVLWMLPAAVRHFVSSPGRLRHATRLGAAVLALIGMGWMVVPMALLATCARA